ncbi:MAG: type II toxin-antitoxin system PemK/MazF family toxin [Clostridia bacterium]|nr:type II toxin-antitoxin system PemK/MazF family toxin [Clostridia bacterium]
MRQTYNKCIEKLEEFKNILINENNIKTGKLYFLWIESKTNKIQNEKNEMYIYNNLIGITLKNYRIDKYNYERLDRKLKNIVDNNYTLKNNNYIFNNNNISISDAKLLVTKILLRRGNVVWIDFGFNIGNEFGGMHPAIILKNFDSELFVLPLSSKKPKEYIKIEQEYKNKKISLEECKKKKDNITEIIELDSVYRFKNMVRWGNITRIRKVSILRLNFYGTIGKVDGKYMNTISKHISKEY